MTGEKMPFTNETILPGDFPKYEEVTTTLIDPGYWEVIRWRFLIGLCVVAVIVILFFVVPGLREAKWYVSVLLLLFISLRYLLMKMAFARRSYAVREHDIIYRHGILSVITTIVPFNRIQHVALLEGFIERKYHVATIQIFTAGGSSADIKVAGLPKEIASALKEIILEKIKK